MPIRSKLTRASMRRSGSTGAGVEQLIAGFNIILTPAGGTGIVTVATGIPSPDVSSFNGATGTVTVAEDSVPGPSGIQINNLGGGAFGLEQNVVANWVLGRTRVYAVDFVSGNDANAGFADPASTSAADYAIACQAAGAVAKKTFTGLGIVIPRVGAGRNIEVVVANGGVNTEQNYAEGIEVMTAGWIGYNAIDIRATGTNTTAGCTKFDGSIADATYLGGITVTGLNAPGYNPTGAATTTSLPMLQVGGAAPALPAEPAAPLGWRVRFDAATATVALRNQCRQIAQVTGGTTIIPQTAFSAVPAVADVFYIEQAGVSVNSSTLSYTAGSNGPTISQSPFNVAGFRSTGALSTTNCTMRIAFCGCETSFNSTGNILLAILQTYTHPVLGILTVGGGVRAGTTSTMTNNAGQVNAAGLVVAGGNANPFYINQLQWGAGSYSSSSMVWQNHSGPAGATSGTASVIGIGAALARPRAQRLSIIACRGQIGGSTFEGAGASPAIAVAGCCVITFSQGVCAGVTGNNDVGMDITNSRNSMIIIVAGSLPTVTGALGDVRLQGGQIVTWAQLSATGIVDGAGNRIIGGTVAIPQAISTFSGSIIGAVGAVISYLADTGPIAANQIVPLRRPTSLRLATRLRVTNLVNTSANAVTVTLYKNGVATAMVVSIPAATAANTKFSDLVHPILFLDDDDFDLRMDDAADVAGVVTVSASLEWAV